MFAQVQENMWYSHLVKPMVILIVRPFMSRVMKNLLPDAHYQVAICREKVVKVKALVEKSVCSGPYAPDRKFEGTRITYTNSGGGFAAMCASRTIEHALICQLPARLILARQSRRAPF